MVLPKVWVGRVFRVKATGQGSDLSKLRGKVMKLNLGCGDRLLDGYVNVDVRGDACGRGVVRDFAETLTAFEGELGLVEEVRAVHVIEHLRRPGGLRPNVEDALRRWCALLRVGGRVVIECPDFEKLVWRYVVGMANGKAEPHLKSWIFGLGKHADDEHRWGYGRRDLAGLVGRCGFRVTSVRNSEDAERAKRCPCMRVDAVKT